MSDDVVDPNDGERNKERMNCTSVSRNATVTDNLDSMFSLLCDSRRRYLLYYLFPVDSNVVELEAAVNAVYTYETAGTETDDQASREAVRVALHHTLLPRLGDAGVLDYDMRQGAMRFTPSSALEEWVEHVQAKELD